MKNIQLINPKQASELLKRLDYSFIQVLTKYNPVVLANAKSFNADQVQGLQIEINMGTAYKIDLASYAEDIILELRDLEWGLLLLINNTEYLLRVNTTSREKEFSQMDKFPELQIIDFGSGKNKYLTNINLISAFKKLHTLNLDNCPALIDIGGLVNLPTLKPLDTAAIFSSVKKTGRILVVDSGAEIASFASEVISQVSRNCFDALKSAPQMICAPDVPEPTSHGVTAEFKFGAADIAKKIIEMMESNFKADWTILNNMPHDAPNSTYMGPF